MIALHNIAKSYPLPRGKKVVLDDVNITFRPGENMGILGLNGAGKSTLMRIIGGAELPDSGKVVRKSRVSWPIGFAGASRVGRICASLPASMVPISGK